VHAFSSVLIPHVEIEKKGVCLVQGLKECNGDATENNGDK
jgi:hypothetical protein